MEGSGNVAESCASAASESNVSACMEVSPRVRQERIKKRKPNPCCFLSSKKYAEIRFGQRGTRANGAPSVWREVDAKANKSGKRRLIVLDDGTEYEGEWQKNLRHGHGEHYTAKGVYEGEFVEDLYEGQGNYFLWSEETNCEQPGKWAYYSGNWYQGKMHGQGVQYETNGNTYEGEFVKGKRTGMGVMYYENGDIYSGQWKNNLRCGEGELIKSNGDVFKGRYENDLRNGPGVLHIRETQRRLEGVWEDDFFKGGSYYDEQENPRYVQPDDISGTTDGLIPTIELKDPDGVLAQVLKRPEPPKARI